MPVTVTYKVTDPGAPRKALDPGIGTIAGRVEAAARQATPVRSGTLAGGWRIVRGRHLAVRFVENPVWYGMFVEFGTSRQRARPMLGPVLARWRAASMTGRGRPR